MSIGTHPRELREWRSQRSYRRIAWSAILLYSAVPFLAIIASIAQGRPGQSLFPAAFLALLVVALSLDLSWAKVVLTDSEVMVREFLHRTKRIPRTSINRLRVRWRDVSFLGVDQLPFAALNRARYADPQLEEMAALLGVPIVGRRRPRRSGRFEDGPRRPS